MHGNMACTARFPDSSVAGRRVCRRGCCFGEMGGRRGNNGWRGGRCPAYGSGAGLAAGQPRNRARGTRRRRRCRRCAAPGPPERKSDTARPRVWLGGGGGAHHPSSARSGGTAPRGPPGRCRTGGRLLHERARAAPLLRHGGGAGLGREAAAEGAAMMAGERGREVRARRGKSGGARCRWAAAAPLHGGVTCRGPAQARGPVSPAPPRIAAPPPPTSRGEVCGFRQHHTQSLPASFCHLVCGRSAPPLPTAAPS